MNPVALTIAIVSSATNAAASLALREASQGRAIVGRLPTPLGPLSDWYLFAVISFGASFVAYALALRDLPPAVAQPMIVGGAYVLLLSASWLITREPLPWQSLLGGVIVIAGLTLIAAAPQAG